MEIVFNFISQIDLWTWGFFLIQLSLFCVTISRLSGINKLLKGKLLSTKTEGIVHISIDNKETQERVAGLNEFKSKLAQIKQMELNALNQRDLTIAQSIENKGLELQSKMHQDEQMRNSILNEQLQLEYNQDYLKAVQEKFKQLGGFDNFTDEDYKLYGRDILSYMADKHPDEIAKIKSNQGLKYKIDTYNNNRMWYSPRIKSAKKGTKLSTFDKLFLSQNKSTQRAVENLNKDIVRIFLQMMK
jgi:hypothetical protein